MPNIFTPVINLYAVLVADFIAFAGILNEVFGSVGTVIRFAGDEFVVLMHKAKDDYYKDHKRER